MTPAPEPIAVPSLEQAFREKLRRQGAELVSFRRLSPRMVSVALRHGGAYWTFKLEAPILPPELGRQKERTDAWLLSHIPVRELAVGDRVEDTLSHKRGTVEVVSKGQGEGGKHVVTRVFVRFDAPTRELPPERLVRLVRGKHGRERKEDEGR